MHGPMAANEFDIIARCFAPLASDDGARGLLDDAALIGPNAGMVVTTDALVEGVHFLPHDPIGTIASKALRVNVSDLVAKGAQPLHALLTLVWPATRPAEEIAVFAEAFGDELRGFGMSLLGGDTCATEGPLTVSVTAFGAPLGESIPARSGALAGDDLWLIGGEIGTAWLGLQLRRGAMPLDSIRRGRDEAEAQAASRELAMHMPDYLTAPGEDFDAEAAWLIALYLSPFVRTECAPVVSAYAHASMDVSDGLVADAGKLGAASEAALVIEAGRVPIAIPAQRWVDNGGDIRCLLAGGDDYVVLFAAAAEARAELEALPGAGALRLTRIGSVVPGSGVRVLDADGAELQFPEAGYAHRLGR